MQLITCVISHLTQYFQEPSMSDSFATRDQLSVNGQNYTIFSLSKLGQQFDISKLPYSMKILLENLLRCEDGV